MVIIYLHTDLSDDDCDEEGVMSGVNGLEVRGRMSHGVIAIVTFIFAAFISLLL